MAGTHEDPTKELAALFVDALGLTADALQGEVTRDRLIDDLIGFAYERVGASCAAYRALSDDGHTLKFQRFYGQTTPSSAVANQYFNVLDDPRESMGVYAFSTQKVYYCNDTAALGPDDPKFACGLTDTRSCITAPVLALGNCHGVASFDSTLPNAFSDEDIELVGVVSRLLGVALDFLDREKTNEEFMGIIAHQIIGPLAGIQGYCKNLADGIYAVAKQPALFKTLVDQAQRLVNTTRSMVYLSRLLLSDKAEIKATPIDLDSFLVETARTYQGDATVRDIRIHVDTERSGDWLVRADEELLRQAISNLIDNAVKYSDPETEVSVRAEKTTKWFRIGIKNRGIYLRGSQIQRIFRKGLISRTEEAVARAPQGSGIGLWVTKRIAELHDGMVHVEQTDRNGKTVFFFCLPLSAVSEKGLLPGWRL